MKTHILLTLFSLSLLSCGSDPDCSTSKDCFRSETCVDGLCVELDSNNTNPNNTNPNNTNPNNITPNNTSSNNTASTYAALKEQYPDSACLVRALDAMCKVPDDNESFYDYLMSGNGAGGCKSGDQSNPTDFTNTLEMCATETIDRYQTNLYPCDSRSFILEVFVTPKVKCHPDLLEINVYTAGMDCSQQSDDFRCMWENGTFHVQAVVPPSGSIGSANVEIKSKYANVIQFDYDLRFLTRD